MLLQERDDLTEFLQIVDSGFLGVSTGIAQSSPLLPPVFQSFWRAPVGCGNRIENVVKGIYFLFEIWFRRSLLLEKKVVAVIMYTNRKQLFL